jgi:hypothetical protein
MSEVFAAIVELAESLGVSGINKLPRCWEHQIDGSWWIAVNAHPEPIQCSHGVAVAPFSAYIEFNGWPAGLFTPHGGQIAAGEVANEDAFIEALRRALAKGEP